MCNYNTLPLCGGFSSCSVLTISFFGNLWFPFLPYRTLYMCNSSCTFFVRLGSPLVVLFFASVKLIYHLQTKKKRHFLTACLCGAVFFLCRFVQTPTNKIFHQSSHLCTINIKIPVYYHSPLQLTNPLTFKMRNVNNIHWICVINAKGFCSTSCGPILKSAPRPKENVRWATIKITYLLLMRIDTVKMSQTLKRNEKKKSESKKSEFARQR